MAVAKCVPVSVTAKRDVCVLPAPCYFWHGKIEFRERMGAHCRATVVR
jgi:hypothetical protein